VGEINGALDLAIFAQQFAKPLNITQRFVGTEPFSPVTDSYNRTMESYLPSQGINVVVVPRLKKDGAAVSASRVRALLAQGKLEEIRGLVPPVTYDYLERLDLHDMC
jgi:[citrate (pro-3S)-lyase] ligase